MNYIKIVIMTYFTENIFKNILSYCDDKIEVKQRKLNLELMKDITFLGNDWFDIERYAGFDGRWDYDYYISQYNEDFDGEVVFKGFREMFDEIDDYGIVEWNINEQFVQKINQFSNKFISNRNTTNNFIEFLENQ